MLYGARANTTTTIKIWACDTTNTGGVLSADCNGSSFNGDTLSSAMDYTGTVTITGLQADTSYAVDIYVAGVLIGSETYKTLPTTGQDVDLMFISDTGEWMAPYAKILPIENEVDALYWIEAQYIEESQYSSAPASAAAIGQGNPASGGGLRQTYNPPSTASNIATSPSAAYTAFRNAYRLKHRYTQILDGVISKKWRRYFQKKYACRFMWDNHDLYSPQSAADLGLPRPYSAQFDGAMQAAWEYMFQGNPPTGGVSTAASVEPHVLINGTLTHKNICFSEVVGDVHVIAGDWMTFSSLTTNFEDDRTLDPPAGPLTAWQRAWLVNTITASTSKFIVLLASRNPQTAENDQAGSGTILNSEWKASTNSIIDAANTLTTTPFIIVSADMHRPYLRKFSLATSHAATAILEVNTGLMNPNGVSASPKEYQAITGETLYFDPLGTPTPGTGKVTNTGGNSETLLTQVGRDACSWTYVKVLARNTYITVELRNSMTGGLLASKTIYAGSKAPV